METDKNEGNTDVESLENYLKMCRVKEYFSIDEVEEMFGVNIWTIKFWINRFDILQPFRNKAGDFIFSNIDVERIGIISWLVKNEGMNLKSIREYLKSTIPKSSEKQRILSVAVFLYLMNYVSCMFHKSAVETIRL